MRPPAARQQTREDPRRRMRGEFRVVIRHPPSKQIATSFADFHIGLVTNSIKHAFMHLHEYHFKSNHIHRHIYEN
ncbi:hypothetical protein [Burkholderia ubonensis]|uniref:hypothetical protein n=1 Tax=Burkholderia ubonensis TaxID=101571 RepID=UPI0012FA8389|nr:hypothetical protein [Burkholderia ubonensis]